MRRMTTVLTKETNGAIFALSSYDVEAIKNNKRSYVDMTYTKQPLFHGSSQRFTQFSLDFIGKNGTALGYGIYLTTNKSLAKQYADAKDNHNGFLYTVSHHLQNELSSRYLTIAKSTIARIIDHLHDACKVLYDFNDVDYYGAEKVKQEAIQQLLSNNNDVDLFNDLANTTGQKDAVVKAFFDVGRYTHTEKDGVVVVFDPTHLRIEDTQEMYQSTE